MPEQTHTWIFQGGSGEVWTEVYTANKSVDLKAALDAIPDELIDARRAFLHDVYSIRAIRASNIGISKRSGYRLLNRGGADAGVGEEGRPELTGGCSVYDVRCDPQGRRFIWFRGLDDSQIIRDLFGADLPGPKSDKLIKDFVKLASAYGYGVRARLRRGERADLFYSESTRVDGMVTPGWAWIYTRAWENYAPGEYVELSQFNQKRLPGLKGTFEVLASEDGAVAVDYTVASLANIVGIRGRLRKLDWHDVAVFDPTSCMLSHHSTRQTNRNFTRSRGAARAVRIRHSV